MLADHTKWGTLGISAVARLKEADTVITDSGLDSAARTLIAADVRKLVLVDAATGNAQVIEAEPHEPSTTESGARR